MIDISEINDYLSQVVDKYRAIEKVWLMGSRLDENTHWKSSPPGDWDLVVFTDKATMTTMKNDKALRTEDIDLIVVYNHSENYVRFRKGESDREKPWHNFEWIEDENGTDATYTARDAQGVQRCFAKVIWSREQDEHH